MAATALGDLLLDLLALPSVTGEEGPIADWLEHRYAGQRLRRAGHSLVVGGSDDGRPVVLLVGHTDVVPPTDADRDPRRDGDRILGRGASGVKSGLAVAMDCSETPALRAGPYDLVLVAYAGEEGPHEGNELGAVLTAMPDLAEAALAVVLEPTDLTVQLGCMGALHAEVSFLGRAAHSARPWQGENALTKAGGFLGELDRRPPQDVDVDGAAAPAGVSRFDRRLLAQVVLGPATARLLASLASGRRRRALLGASVWATPEDVGRQLGPQRRRRRRPPRRG